jgi:hypothetical protein
MDSQKVDPHPTPAETDSTQTNESVEISKPGDPADKDPSYLRSREIALKKFIPQGGESE